MSTTPVDTLSIDFVINDTGTKTLDKIVSKVDKLDKSLQSLSKLNTKSFSNLEGSLKGISKALETFNRANMGNLNRAVKKITDVYENLEKISALNLENVNKSIASIVAGATTLQDNINKKSLVVSEKKAKEEETRLTRLAKRMDKIRDSFGRILGYRLARGIIKSVVTMARDGLESVAQYNENTAKSYNDMKNQMALISNSLGATLMAVVKTLQPVLVFLTKVVTDLSNNISKLFASMSKNKTWYKATLDVKEYTKAMKQAKNEMLGIDELNVLGGKQQDSKPAFIEEISSAGKGFEGFAQAATTIGSVLIVLGTLKALLSEGSLGAGIKKLGSAFADSMKDGMMNLKEIHYGLKKTNDDSVRSSAKIKLAGATIAGFMGAVATATTAYASFVDVFRGTKKIESALLSLIPVIILVGIKLQSSLGWIGWVLAAIGAVIGVLAGWIKAQRELGAELANTAMLKNYGNALEDVVQSMNEYMDSLHFKRIEAFNQEMSGLRTTFDNNKHSLEQLLSQTTLYISGVTEFVDSKEQLDEISKAFDNLTDSINNLNSAKVANALNSIGELISANIGEKAATHLSRLQANIKSLKMDLEGRTAGIRQDIEDVFYESYSKTGKFTLDDSQKERVKNLYEQLINMSLDKKDNFFTAKAASIENMRFGGVQDLENIVNEFKQQSSGKAESYHKDFLDNYDVMKQLMEKSGTVDSKMAGQMAEDMDYYSSSAFASYQKIVSETDSLTKMIGEEAMRQAKANMVKILGQHAPSRLREADVYAGINYMIKKDIGFANTYKHSPGTKERAREHFGIANRQQFEGFYEKMRELYKKGMEISAQANNKNAIKDITKFLPQYATGGFPKVRSIFSANENEIELMGHIGTSPVVINNNQIIEGVSQGVANAVAQVLLGANESGDLVINIDVDGTRKETIVTSLDRGARREGELSFAR